MEHAPGFLKLVNEERPYVKEITVEEAREQLRRNSAAILMDVREDTEWQHGHAADALHLGKGVLERDLERMFPDPNREIIMYSTSGYRSVLTAAAAHRMGYRRVYSLIGGYTTLAQSKWRINQGD